MNIRNATIQDTSAIIELWTKSNLLRPLNKHEKDITNALAAQTSVIFLAELKEKIIGTILAGYDGHRGWIYYLAVDEEYQKQGYGKQLLKEAEEWLQNKGATAVHLLTRKNNESAQKFYDKIGYKISDVTVMSKKFEK